MNIRNPNRIFLKKSHLSLIQNRYRASLFCLFIFIMTQPLDSRTISPQEFYELMDSFNIGSEIRCIKTSLDGKQLYITTGNHNSWKLTYLEFDENIRKLEKKWERSFNFPIGIDVSDNGDYVLARRTEYQFYSPDPEDVLFLITKDDEVLKSFKSCTSLISSSLSDNNLISFTKDADNKIHIYDPITDTTMEKTIDDTYIEAKWEGRSLIAWAAKKVYLFENYQKDPNILEVNEDIYCVTATEALDGVFVTTYSGFLLIYTEEDISQNREASNRINVGDSTAKIILGHDASNFILNTMNWSSVHKNSISISFPPGDDTIISASKDLEYVLFSSTKRDSMKRSIILYKIENTTMESIWELDTSDFEGEINQIHLALNRVYFIIGTTRGFLHFYKTYRILPSIEFAPLNDFVSGKISIGAQLGDSVSQVNLFIRNRNVSDKLPYSWDTTKENDGQYLISLRAYDDFQNENSKSVSVTVDNTPPAITILSPKESERHYWSVIVDQEITDRNLEMTETSLSLDEKPVRNPVFPYKWNIWRLDSGPHVIRIEAVDKAGNRSSEVVTIVKVGTIELIEERLGKALSRFIRSASRLLDHPLMNFLFIVGAIASILTVAISFAKYLSRHQRNKKTKTGISPKP